MGESEALTNKGAIMGRELLNNIFYGDEIANEAEIIGWPKRAFPDLSEGQLSRIRREILSHFSNVKNGIFGGPITAGDASVIAALIEHVRPVQMVEFGVASGWSSSFILRYAKSAGLISDDVFLHSFDLCREHAEGKLVGSYLMEHHRDLSRHWSLNTEITSATLLSEEWTVEYRKDGPILAFVDGGHNHPWPVLDLIYLYKALPRGSWVVLQDVQMMERWIADCVIYNVASPPPVRGVNYAVSHWPGTKVIGFGMAYNSAAIRLDIPDWQFRGFVEEMKVYPHEIPFEFDHLLHS